MARAPSDDAGKTRLLGAFGGERAQALRRAILLDTLETARRVRGVDQFVVFTPEAAASEFETLVGGADGLLGQRGQGLGERMEHACDDLLARGYAGVVMIGSDLPTLPAEYVEQGIETLSRQPDPLVLGPAEDGGYYLMGLRRCHPELFRDIPWSTSGVLSATLEAAASLGVVVTMLPAWHDVDSADDLERVLRSAEERGLPIARHVRAWAHPVGAERRGPPRRETTFP